MRQSKLKQDVVPARRNKRTKMTVIKDRNIPVYYEKFDQIKEYLHQNSSLAMILIDGSKIDRIEQEYGKSIYGNVLSTLKRIVAEMKGTQIRQSDIATVNHAQGDQFLIFLSKKREEKGFQSGDIEGFADRISRYINGTMFKTIFPLLHKRPKISVGYSLAIHNPLIQEERLIHKLIEDAKIMANYQEFRNAIRNKEKLQEIIIKEEITTVYQPIINMITRKIIGHEALSRGPKNTEYENPYVLFSIAEESGLLFELDRLCRKRALINAKGIKEGLRIFVNVIPTTIHDPEFRGKYLTDFLIDLNINPRNIVLEVTERLAIENFEIFKEATDYYSNLGFAIAVDDTGTGYSNLENLIKLKLEYVKIDISLISEIDKNPLKKELVRAIVHIARNIGAEVIAEGIETKEEMNTLLDIAVIYGQGFLFARPDNPFPEINSIEF